MEHVHCQKRKLHLIHRKNDGVVQTKKTKYVGTEEKKKDSKKCILSVHEKASITGSAASHPEKTSAKGGVAHQQPEEVQIEKMRNWTSKTVVFQPNWQKKHRRT